MCCQKSCEALVAPPDGELFARHLPGEREACMSCGAGSGFDLPLREQAGAANGTAAADSGDRTSQSALWIPQDPVLLNREGWKVGKKLDPKPKN